MSQSGMSNNKGQTRPSRLRIATYSRATAFESGPATPRFKVLRSDGKVLYSIKTSTR